jgi:ribosomal protein L21
MGKQYRSARGKAIDIDQLRLQNEDVIAVGNMKVNARGDELGFGGKVVKSRNEVMNDYYKIKSPTVVKSKPVPDQPVTDKPVVEQPVTEAPAQPTVKSNNKLRGSLASQIAEDGDK